ncbi:MAG: sugar ABC transporter substrate-binding protein [Bacteroidota bacterium]
MRILLLIVVVSMFLSCSNEPPQEDGRITLKLYHWMERDRKLWEEEIIKPFEQAHPTIRVVLETSPYSLFVSKSLTSMASGLRVADVMFAEDWFGQELIHRKYGRNLMPYVARDFDTASFYHDAFREWQGTAQRDDELFGFPVAIGLTVLFYNKDLFDAAGVSYPDTSWTYADLLRAGKQLTLDRDRDGNPEQWGLQFDIHYTGLETVVYSLGGRTLNEQGNRAVMTEPATQDAFRFVRDIFRTDRIASNVTTFINPWEPFVSRRAAMNLIGSHGSLNLEGTGIRWDLAVPPKGPGGKRLSRRYSMAFLIPHNSPHPDEAWELLKWIITKSPVQTIDRQYLGLMPVYRPHAESSEWLHSEPRYNRRVLVELAQSQSFPLFSPGWQEWRDNNLTPELQLMIQGKKTVEQFTRDAERRINNVLEWAYR